MPSLKRSGFSVGQIHGDMEQADRIASSTASRTTRSTSSSRPTSPRARRQRRQPRVQLRRAVAAGDYIHRIGRTGRAGAKGISITIATREDREAVASIESCSARRSAAPTRRFRPPSAERRTHRGAAPEDRPSAEPRREEARARRAPKRPRLPRGPEARAPARLSCRSRPRPVPAPEKRLRAPSRRFAKTSPCIEPLVEPQFEERHQRRRGSRPSPTGTASLASLPRAPRPIGSGPRQARVAQVEQPVGSRTPAPCAPPEIPNQHVHAAPNLRPHRRIPTHQPRPI